jgi:hypothetical protein
MPLRLHGVPQRLLTRGRAGKNLDLATTVIVEPLDVPLAGRHAILGQQRRLSVDVRGIWSKLLRVGANLHGESGKGSSAVVRFSSSTCVWLSRHRRVRRSFLTMMPGRHRCRRDNRVPDPQPRAAHRFTPLTFGQADDKPAYRLANAPSTIRKKASSMCG